jgi:hypothetical protein
MLNAEIEESAGKRNEEPSIPEISNVFGLPFIPQIGQLGHLPIT